MCFLPLKSSHYPSRPVPVPELFGKYPTRPVPKSKTPTRQTLLIGELPLPLRLTFIWWTTNGPKLPYHMHTASRGKGKHYARGPTRHDKCKFNKVGLSIEKANLSCIIIRASSPQLPWSRPSPQYSSFGRDS